VACRPYRLTARATSAATVSAIYGLGDPNLWLKMVVHLNRGGSVNQRDLLRRLAELQYTRNDMELGRATYRVRGDVIDIHPAESERDAIRIELYDDEIERLSYFDPLTGRVIREVPRLTVFPKSHYVTPQETLLNAIDQIRGELAERLENLRSENRLVEAQRLEQRTRYDMEMIREVGYCAGIENYSRYLSGRDAGQPPPTLYDYLPADALVVADESHVSIPQLGAMFRGDRSRKETLVEYGFRLPSALDNRPLRFEEWESLTPQIIFVSATPGNYEERMQGQLVRQVVRPTGLVDPELDVRPASTQVDDLLSEIRLVTAREERVLVTVLTKRMAEDLTDYLAEHDVRVRYLHSDIDTVERSEILRDLRLGSFDVLVGINLLREGLDIPEVSLVAVLDADKEGFLRSDRSLIQTIGRAARNLNGRAILYADAVTGSMRRAIDESNRRRERQLAFNREHGITPAGIRKSVLDVMEGAHASPGGSRQRKAAERTAAYAISKDADPQRLKTEIARLEKEMREQAKALAFEQAAQTRDRIAELKNRLFY